MTELGLLEARDELERKERFMLHVCKEMSYVFVCACVRTLCCTYVKGYLMCLYVHV